MSTERLELKTRRASTVILGILVVALVGVLVAFGNAPGILFGGLLAMSYLYFAVRAFQRRLILDGEGITDTGIFTSTTIRWDDVDHYTFYSLGQQYAAGGQGGLLVILIVAAARAMSKKEPHRAFGTGRLQIRAGDGRKVSVSQIWHDADVALDTAFAQLHPRLSQRASATPTELFAPVQLTDYALTMPKQGEIALAEIERVDVHNGVIKIKKRDKRFAWASIGQRRVKNSMLLLDQLAERGMVVKASKETFLPPPVIAKMLAAQDRAAALPTARVVQR
jgi:hypothetical protein